SLASSALARWNDLSLAARRELASALAGSPACAEPLVIALERQAIAPSELDGPTREALLRLRDAAVRSRAAAVIAKYRPVGRSTALHRYQTSLALRGDPRRGATLFDRHCQPCHQHQGKGQRVGPDLSGIAGRAPDALLSDILDPNREVAPD